MSLAFLTGDGDASCGEFTGRSLHYALCLQIVFSGLAEQKAFCAWELRVFANTGLKDC
jgi:hypothetical protein